MSLPPVGTIVVVKVTRILNYGAFVELLEHDGQSGFVHISEIASRWTKNIRNHVKDNQIRAAKVLNVNPQKRQVDLSFLKVSPDAERAKLEEFKQTRKSLKLLEVLAKKKGVAFAVIQRDVADPLLKSYETLFDAFTQVALDGPSAATGVSAGLLPELAELCASGFSIPEKSVEGTIFLQSLAGDGVETVKKALAEIERAARGEKLSLFYTGSGKYCVRAFALDYKTAEKLLLSALEAGVKTMESQGGTARFERQAGR